MKLSYVRVSSVRVADGNFGNGKVDLRIFRGEVPDLVVDNEYWSSLELLAGMCPQLSCAEFS